MVGGPAYDSLGSGWESVRNMFSVQEQKQRQKQGQPSLADWWSHVRGIMSVATTAPGAKETRLPPRKVPGTGPMLQNWLVSSDFSALQGASGEAAWSFRANQDGDNDRDAKRVARSKGHLRQ